jgi:hypothetical protein
MMGSVEGRRNDASQPYRFGSRSVPRRPFSFDFAELVSPHVHTRKRKEWQPYEESGNRFSVLMYTTFIFGHLAGLGSIHLFIANRLIRLWLQRLGGGARRSKSEHVPDTYH